MRDLDKPVLTAIGVISGTSMDAIDVSIVESDGRERLSFGAGAGYPYPPETRRQLQALEISNERPELRSSLEALARLRNENRSGNSAAAAEVAP